MTNPNNQTNGASLEDCHTNFFALTDLCGIKWRKVVWVGGGLTEWGEPQPAVSPSEPLDDPVLASYVKCISADMLCVWRRVSTPTSRSPGDVFDQLGLSGPPPAPPHHHPPLSLAAAKELWIFWYGEEPDLSSLIAPELLQGDGEQGSWESGLSYECRSLLFKALHNLIERCLLSRDFVRIGKWYVQPYDSSEKVLEKSGHYSFAFDFFVHGESQVCASIDVRQHPPVRTLLPSHLQQAALHSQPPVNVILAPFGLAGTLTGQTFRLSDPQTQRLLENWRFFYPIDRGHHTDLPPAVEVVVGGMKLRYPSHYVLLTDMDDSTKALFSNQLDLDSPTKVVHPVTRGLNRVGLLAERVWQETLVVHGMGSTPIPVSNTGGNGGGGNNSVGSAGASSGGGSGGNTPVSSSNSSGQAPPTPGGQIITPSNSPQPGQWNFVDPTRKQSCSCSCKLNCGASMGQNDSVPIPSVGSPNAPDSPTPPSVPPPTDPTMPLLSPQPPQQHHISPCPLLDDKVVSTPIDFNAPKSVPSISNQMLSPYGDEAKALTETASGPGSVGTGVGGKATPLAARTPLAAPPPTPPPQPPPQTQPPPTPKRPHLTSSDYEEALCQENRPSDLLYDYTLLEAWLNHPVKRFKPSPPSQPPVQQQTFKQEPSVPNPSIDESPFSGNRGGPGDPYDFNDDGMHINSYNRVPIKEEEKPLVNGTGPSPSQGKLSSTSLFSNDSLQVSYNDLDHIFNNSDENSGDEVLGVTPPSSNKGLDEVPVTTLTSRPCLTNGVQGILRPEELCKMFPTPPSLEHPLPSPGDDHPQATSPLHQPIQDWSYVFKPSPISRFVGSSKYSPLITLPSHSLPPVTLPPNSVYKPSWSIQHQEKQISSTSCNRGSNNSGGNSGSVSSGGRGSCGPQTPSLPALPPSTPTAAASPAPPAPWGRAPPPPYSPAQAQYPPPATLTHPHVPPPEANSIVVIVLLSDTAFNIFRDHNFDSCTLCVCNDSPKGGNIRGSDAGMYLIGAGGGGYSPLSPSPHIPLEEEHIRCNCGFSAVMNRRLSHRAGLFIEDEIEICGMFDEMGERETTICVGRLEMELMAGQCLAMNSSSNALYRAATQFRPASPLPMVNLLSLRDSNYISLIALEQGRLAAHHSQSLCKMEEMSNFSRSGTGPVHRWAHMRAKGPPSNQDIVRVMKQLQPLLQDAIQKKCTTRLWEAPTVSGPLTWRQFHRLAGRGTDDRCEPQPIPSLVMGREKDWITLAPYAVHLWEKLLLEPYSYSRDIAYIVVAPDHDYVLNSVRTFFKELSSMYEVCRLGRHVPITKVLRDGILRVGKTAAIKLAKEPLDEWFSNLSDSYQANMLKLYAQVCRYHLAPHLSQVQLDKTLLDSPEGSAPSPRSTLNTSDQPNTPKQPDSQDEGNGSGCEYSVSGGGGVSTCSSGSSIEEDGADPPMIVVYLVEPFTVGADSPELQRLSCVGLLKAFNTVIANVPEQLRSNISLQVISLESVLELGRSGETNRRSDHMRTLAISVFCQARKTMVHSTNNIKALTGFGTAASNEVFLKNKDEKNRAPYKVYTPAYILAKSREKPSGAPGGADSESSVSSSDHCSVLYVSYCLSEDQRWLLATATDEHGLLLESVSINVHIPNSRARRRRASARRAGLQKLMDFMLGVMSQSVTPWRLVVGRVGRIGHGELKGWSGLLSRKSLLKASKNLKEICGQCNLLYPHDVPCILSACLVSLEPDSALRLMPDQFTPDERFSQASVKCSLSTPGDVSATHILVFPTSATTQSSQTAFQEQHINVPDLGDDELLSVLNDDMPEGMSDFNDIFSHWPEADGGGGGEGGPENGGGPGRGGRPDSPSPTPPHSHPHSPYQHSAGRANGEGSEEVGALLQQPLALGYLVSTAPTGRMPRWFWSACPHLEAVSPPFLKNALHLHSTAVLANSDELLQQQTAVAGHALDSQYTTDVLRYVLEGYNALSWLALDSNTHDRLSCLPVHMQVLMQLYHMTAALA